MWSAFYLFEQGGIAGLAVGTTCIQSCLFSNLHVVTSVRGDNTVMTMACSRGEGMDLKAAKA